MLTLKDIAIDEFDFIDFGASKGDSIQNAIDYLGGKRGLGIDLVPTKVELTSERGYTCVQGDATNVDLPDKCVDFVVMSHFLEHLPSEELVAGSIRSGIRLARKFVFIKGPWFDADYYLHSLGLKFYWSHWKCHPTHFDIAMFERVIKDFPELNYGIYGKESISDSSHAAVHPLESPSDIHHYRVEHGFKPSIEFSRPVFREILCVVDTGIGDISFVNKLESKVFPVESLLEGRREIYTREDIENDQREIVRERQTRFLDYNKYSYEVDLFKAKEGNSFLATLASNLIAALESYREGPIRLGYKKLIGQRPLTSGPTHIADSAKKFLQPHRDWLSQVTKELSELRTPNVPRWSKQSKEEIERGVQHLQKQIAIQNEMRKKLESLIEDLKAMSVTCSSALVWNLFGKYYAWQELQSCNETQVTPELVVPTFEDHSLKKAVGA